MDTLTMNIRRRFFAEIVAGTKEVEYRQRSKSWRRRIEPLTAPFRLRLLNGMTHPVPEVLVVVRKVTSGRSPPEYQLHLGPVLAVKRWNRKTRRPRA